MAVQKFSFGTPADLDEADGVQQHVLACRYFCDVAAPHVGGEWYRPTNAPTNTLTMCLWRHSDQVLLRSKTFTAPSTGLVQATFDTPFNGLANEHYVIGVLTNRYVFTAPGAWPYTTTNLTAPNQVASVNVNGCFALNTGGALTFPATTPAGRTNYHVSPLVDVPDLNNATLHFSLPALASSFSGSASANASLGITLPALSADMSGIQGILAVSLREYVFQLLRLDAGLNSLGINESSIFGTNAADSPSANLQRWVIVRWGLEDPPPGRDTTSRRRFISIWAYDRDRDFSAIDPILDRCRAIVYPLKAVHYNGSGGYITEVSDNGYSDDLWDDAYSASSKNWQATIIASGR